MFPSNPLLISRLSALEKYFGPGQGAQMARTQVYTQLNQQAGVLGYADVYRLLSWVALVMCIGAMLLSKNKPGEGAPAGEAIG